MNHLAWQEWNPRLQDYWRGFTHPYRHKIVEHVSKNTPLDGSVLEFGCAVGINLFLLKLKRPDVKIIGCDINAQARNLAHLLTEDWGVEIREAPLTAKDIPDVDTIFTTFTLAYMEYPFLMEHLKVFCDKAKVLVLGEPTVLTEDANMKQDFHGLPCPGWAYAYPYILRKNGRDVEVDILSDMKTVASVNAITIAR